MFRITQYLHEIVKPTPLRPKRNPPGPVVIWNLGRRCNLQCRHCYSSSANQEYPGELSTAQIQQVMEDLRAYGVPVLILSGGEPLLRPDIFEISAYARNLGFYVGLSSNGTLITDNNIQSIADAAYDYVGVSLDGIRRTHDRFRRKIGAFEEALQGIRRCRKQGIKVGIRFTLTTHNAHELPQLLALMEQEDLQKFYLSHLNYGGRGLKNRKDDVYFEITRSAMDLLFDTAWEYVNQGTDKEFVTGNNDADGAYLLYWIKRNFPESLEHLTDKLEQWGGNSSGVNIANIDNLGNVHPDTFWSDYTLGNVLERPFSEIWSDVSDPIMAGLKHFPRAIQGRCASCNFFSICGGNTRVRAWQMTGNPWAEDPGCYLTNEEIGLEPHGRIRVKPLQGRVHAI
ncbi:MAG: heme d1 biosynthesis radical SAM protein NirJ [SAR324 cluster bacterium]|nr:heme d1 biosynthesis radical SAM protein NirJ [SAR324 cluster bacterium]